MVAVGVLYPAATSAQEEAKPAGASGVVIDSETGETLPFAQIYFVDGAGKTTNIGTTTDMDGQFSLTSTKGYTTMNIQMVGYKTEMLTVRKGQIRTGLKVKMKPDVYGLQDIVVTPKHRKREYRRKNNPAVELIKKVIENKEKYTVKTEDHYIADSYARMSFAMDNFHPNFKKGFWKTFNFIEKYIDTTGVYPSLTVSIREHLNKEFYQRKPHREKKIVQKKRIFGIEDVINSSTFQENVNAIFKDVDLNTDNLNLLFTRFVSPLNTSLAVNYYQYYIMDTILVDGYPCIDLAFVPVNSQSNGFTGHLYIVNDSTYKIKRYAINIPPEINLNFVSDFSIEHSYKQLDNGLWAPDRTTTYAKFYIFTRKHGLLARQTKIYTGWDFESQMPPRVFSSLTGNQAMGDTATVRIPSKYWVNLRPEPLTKYETAVSDLVEEFERNPTFNRLAQMVNALSTQFINTSPIEKMDSSKWDFGPIFSFFSWNSLEGCRFRVGGQTTANVNPHWFIYSYAAFGAGDLRPKGNFTVFYCFGPRKYHPYDSYVNHLRISGSYDVETPGQSIDELPRDNIFQSIPFSKPTLTDNLYVAKADIQYHREWKNNITLKVGFDYSYNEAAGALTLDRVMGHTISGYVATTQRFYHFHKYDSYMEFLYSPGMRVQYDRMGQESNWVAEKDAPIFRVKHYFGYLDDRDEGGKGFIYNRTELQMDKRFWFSAFGAMDLQIKTGMVWQQVPYTQLITPSTNTSIFFSPKGFNLMQPMEFLLDEYVSASINYDFMGWILNRIPGINRLKLRGVVGFNIIYGGLTNKNNPYKTQGDGLYLFPNDAKYNNDYMYVSGSTSTPIGKLPYMEVTAGIANIFKFLRVDYVRRLTYNEYLLPDGIHTRKIGAWGRNGIKISLCLSL